VPGVTVDVRMRDIATSEGEANASERRDDERRACLDLLSRRHDLPPLEIKTFWDVALDVAAAP
jgi:hypothetical protein